MHRTHRLPTPLLALFVTLGLLAAACGDDDPSVAASGDPVGTEEGADTDDTDDTGAEDGDATFPVTVTADGDDVTIEQRPESIVSLSPTATEMVFAIGAGDRVTAVDSLSNFPEEAPTTELSGFEPNVEAVIEHEPDLVLVSGDRNDVVAGLGSAGVPALVLPAATTLEDTYDQLHTLGEATGDVRGAEDVVASMQAEIEELVSSVPERDEPLTYYHELDDTLFSVTSSTFVGNVYALAGLENVADAADPDGESGGYPQLSAEFLVEADPDLIFLADTKCCGQTAETLAERPGFDQLTAVTEGRVFELDDDITSRWGPRVVDFLAVVVEATRSLEGTS